MLLVLSPTPPVPAAIMLLFKSAVSNVWMNVVSPTTVEYLNTGIPVSAKIPSSVKPPSEIK